MKKHTLVLQTLPMSCNLQVSNCNIKRNIIPISYTNNITMITYFKTTFSTSCILDVSIKASLISNVKHGCKEARKTTLVL